MNMLFLFGLLLVAFCAEPPVAQTIEYKTTKYGKDLIDDYYYMSAFNTTYKTYNDDILLNEFLYSDSYVDVRLEDILDEYMRESIEAMNETEVKVGGLFYHAEFDKTYRTWYSRSDPSEEDRTLVFKEQDLEEILFAKGGSYFVLNQVIPTIDGKHVAVAYDGDGDGRNDVMIYDVVGEKWLDDLVEKTGEYFGWNDAGDKLVFLANPTNAFSSAVKCHTIGGSDDSIHALTEQEIAAGKYLTLSKTSDGTRFLINIMSHDGNEILDFVAAFTTVPTTTAHEAYTSDVFYYLDYDGEWFTLSNKDSDNFQVIVDVNGTDAVIMDGGQTELLQKIRLTEHFVVVLSYDLKEFVSNITLFDRTAYSAQKIDFVTVRERNEYYGIELVESSSKILANYQYFDAEYFEFNIESFITPRRVFKYTLRTKMFDLVYEEHLSGFTKNNMVNKLEWFKSSNGTVDVPLIYAYDSTMDGAKNYMYLYTFSTHGDIEMPKLDEMNYLLLREQWKVGIVNGRGSAIKGMDWWKQGKLVDKKNSMEDLTSAIKFVSEGITKKENLVIGGDKAGGLIAMSVAVKNPTDVAYVVVQDPYTDFLTSMLENEKTYYTKVSIPEFGDPDKVEDIFNAMYDYDPYWAIEPLTDGDYPTMFLAADWQKLGSNYWETVKFAQKLRLNKRKEDDKPVAVEVQMSQSQKRLTARKVSFFFKKVTDWKWSDPLEWLWILISIIVLGGWMIGFMVLFIVCEIAAKRKKSRKGYDNIVDEKKEESESKDG